MFTTIFTLALRKAGTKGSMAIAFLIPLVGYGVIGKHAAKNSSTGVERGSKSDEYWETALLPYNKFV